MAAGSPCVVSTGVAAAADLIEVNVSGDTFDAGDAAALAGALQRVRAALASGTITAETCRSRVRHHSLERATDGLVRAARRVRREASVDPHSSIYVVLLEFAAWPPGRLEQEERLEQLRAVERGVKIRVVSGSRPFAGVDTPEQLAALERRGPRG